MSNIDYVHQVSPLPLRLRSILKSWRRKSLSQIRLFAIIIVFSAENSIVIEFEIVEVEKNLQLSHRHEAERGMGEKEAEKFPSTGAFTNERLKAKLAVSLLQIFVAAHC